MGPCFSVWQATLVAFVELLVLAGNAVSIFYQVMVFWRFREVDGAQFDAFMSLHYAADQLYELATFSAMQLFNKAHPELVGRKWQTFQANVRSESNFYHVLAFIYFCVS